MFYQSDAFPGPDESYHASGNKKVSGFSRMYPIAPVILLSQGSVIASKELVHIDKAGTNTGSDPAIDFAQLRQLLKVQLTGLRRQHDDRYAGGLGLRAH